MNDWLQKTFTAMQIQITSQELQAVSQLHQMIMAGMSEVNRLEMGELEPILTYTLKGSEVK